MGRAAGRGECGASTWQRVKFAPCARKFLDACEIALAVPGRLQDTRKVSGPRSLLSEMTTGLLRGGWLPVLVVGLRSEGAQPNC